MTEMAAAMVWGGLGVYAAIGFAVALWLAAAGLKRFDMQAARAPLRVKAALMPGMIALWPLMIARAAGARPTEDRP